jgi:hypothetical protein
VEHVLVAVHIYFPYLQNMQENCERDCCDEKY